MTTPKTELRNPASAHMDKMSSAEMARLVIAANYEAVKAAEDASADVALAIDAVASALKHLKDTGIYPQKLNETENER